VEFVQELKRAFNDGKERRVKTRVFTRLRVCGHRNKVVALSIGEVDAFNEGLFWSGIRYYNNTKSFFRDFIGPIYMIFCSERVLASGKSMNTALRSLRRSITASYTARSPASTPPTCQSTTSLSVRRTRSLSCTPRCYSIATLEDVPPEYLRYPLPDNCQVLKLPDHRHLSYAEYGSKAPNAHPFIFIHGIPDTRLDACLLSSDRAIAQKLNIRWIGIDRPGIGLSTFQPNRTVLGWVQDLKCLILYLKLDRYRIFSVSGGTGYALACAKLLPREQLRSVG
jgi:hypothetical protein